MSFKKPFKAEPVILGPYWRAEQKRIRRKKMLRQAAMTALLAFFVFLFGMTVTNWTSLRAKLPTYYPNCAWARANGAAPIKRGEPGYRAALDADEDGIACEPYRGR
jgi:hypothetical protein